MKQGSLKCSFIFFFTFFLQPIVDMGLLNPTEVMSSSINPSNRTMLLKKAIKIKVSMVLMNVCLYMDPIYGKTASNAGPTRTRVD